MPKKEQHSFSFLPLTLSLETLGGIATPLVLRGTPLPTKRTQVFSTATDNQQAVTIRASMGERPFAKDNLTLTEVTLTDLPPAPRGKTEIAVTFEIDTSCNVTVSAIERTSGKQIATEAQAPEEPLSPQMIEQLLREAEENRDLDQNRRDEVEAKNEAEAVLRRADVILQEKEGSGGLTEKDKNMTKLVAELGLALQKGDIKIIRGKTAQLKELESAAATDFSDIFSNIFSTPGPFSSYNTRSRSHPKPPPAASPAVDSSSSHSQAQKSVTKEKSGQPQTTDTRHQGLGAIYGGTRYPMNPNLCFVLMPFDDKLRPVYEDHIRPVVESDAFACIRADDIVGTKAITLDIWEHINRARFIIADLTGKNANVFYELGLAHALGKEVILMTQTMDDVPFDLKSLRCIVYSFTPRGMSSMEKTLRQTIQQIMRST